MTFNYKFLFGIFLLIIAFVLFSPSTVNAQGVKISSTPGNPDPSSILEVESSTKGFLLPRLTTTQRNNISNPATGLQIFNTTTNCVQVYFPVGGWLNLKCDCNLLPSSTFSYNPLSPTTNSNVTFTPAQSGLSYNWAFQSGSPSTSNAINPVVQWSNSGTYNVTLVVTDNNGCSSTTSATITIAIPCASGSQVFAYTGANQTFTIPNCVTQIFVKMWGAGGGGGNGGSGGSGAFVSGYLAVTPSSNLTIIVGGAGIHATNSAAAAGGFGGGGASGSSSNTQNQYAASGGGRSAIQITLGTDAVTAGAGGGGGAVGNSDSPWGGGGGAPNGADGGPSAASLHSPGHGGTTTAGGAGTSNTSAGSSQTGSAGGNDLYGGGGGGSGYFGGSGGGGYYNTGDYGGGGGGSSYVANLTTPTIIAGNFGNNNTAWPAPNNTDVNYVSGIGTGSLVNTNGGNGRVVIYW